jgi:hypothetical protein
VIEAELQAVLNTLTEHDFQDTFKKWQKRWEPCICEEGDYFEGDGGYRSDGSTTHGIMDDSLYTIRTQVKGNLLFISSRFLGLDKNSIFNYNVTSTATKKQ